jgi:hypothetical protein
MITIKTYLYPIMVEVQIFDPTIFTTRNRVVYSRTIRVYQGIDNPVQIVIKNQDQKAVDLTGYTVDAQIQDPVNQLTVATYPVTFGDITRGQGTFTFTKPVIDDLEQRFYKLTFKVTKTSDNSEAPLYIDDNYGVPLDLEIMPAYWSNMAPAPGIDQSVVDGGYI